MNAAEPPADGPPAAGSGESIGRFPDLEVGRLLGRGGMGAVYEARQTRLDRTVALKVLPPELCRDAAFAGRFRREAKALAKLGHPNVVTVFDFGAAPPGDDGRDGPFYLVMEFVDGPDLRATLNGDPRPSPAETLAIARQVCAALDYAHGRGVVHRDVKPENVLLSRDGPVKIADFGLAKLAGAEGASAADAPTTLTRAGQVMGTPQYMAPEQLTGGAAVDHRADLYAVGVLLYELLTGALPLGRYEPPSVRAGVPAAWDGIVHRALEVDPAARYPTAAALLADLDRLAAGGAGGTASVGDAGPGLITRLALEYEETAARAGRPVPPLAGREKLPAPVPFYVNTDWGTYRGRAHLEGDGLLFEWDAGWFGRRSMKTVRLSLEALLSVECRAEWWGGTSLRLAARRATDFGDLPGVKQGRAALGVAGADRPAAVAFARAAGCAAGLPEEADGPAAALPSPSKKRSRVRGKRVGWAAAVGAAGLLGWGGYELSELGQDHVVMASNGEPSSNDEFTGPYWRQTVDGRLELTAAATAEFGVNMRTRDGREHLRTLEAAATARHTTYRELLDRHLTVTEEPATEGDGTRLTLTLRPFPREIADLRAGLKRYAAERNLHSLRLPSDLRLLPNPEATDPLDEDDLLTLAAVHPMTWGTGTEPVVVTIERSGPWFTWTVEVQTEPDTPPRTSTGRGAVLPDALIPFWEARDDGDPDTKDAR